MSLRPQNCFWPGRSRTLIVGLILFGFFLPNLPAHGATKVKTIHKAFSFSPKGQLLLKIGNAHLRVTAWDSAKIDLKITEQARNTSLVKAERALASAEIATRLQGKRFVLESHLPQGHFTPLDVFTSAFWKQKIQRVSARFELKVPRFSALTVKGKDKRVHIRGVSGEIHVTLDDGAVTLENCAAPLLTLETDNGAIHVENTAAGKAGSSLLFSTGQGDVVVKEGNFQKMVGNTKTGDILLLNVRVGTLDLSTQTGNLELVLRPSPLPAYRLDSRLGDIFLYLPTKFSARCEASTDEGLLFTGGKIPVTGKEDGARCQTTLGDGKGRVTLHTREGDIRLQIGNTGGTDF